MAGQPPPYDYQQIGPHTLPAPAPTPSAVPLQKPVVVVGPQFLAPYPVELVVTKKLMTLKQGQFTVTDVNQNVIFTVKGSAFSMHDKRVLLDAMSNPLLTLRQKLDRGGQIMTAHIRWRVYKGDSSEASDVIMNVKRTSFFQFNTKLDVFMAGNTLEQLPDFHIKGKFFESGCTIYLGNTSTVLAQMHRHHSLKSIFLDKDTYHCVAQR